MIIDAHTHICPPEIRAARSAFFKGEEDFALLYEDPAARLIGADELVETLDAWGAISACAFGFPFNDDSKTRLVNDYVMASAKARPGRVIPFVCVNPMRGAAAVKEVERCIESGAKGIGEIATYKAGMTKEVRDAIAPIANIAAEADIPLLLHTNEPVGHSYPGKANISPEETYALVKAHPETKWILAHLGGGLFTYALLKREAPEVLKNVWYDTAAAPFLYRPEVYRAMREAVGIEKIVYGSDYPLLPLERYKTTLVAAGLSVEEQALVLGGNMAEVLGL
ncbi:MAG: amidohydrolase [Deltaproteobacteria bacterium]|nr:MAG: amidohydrolase [Deltaproteobacteria bacterium]